MTKHMLIPIFTCSRTVKMLATILICRSVRKKFEDGKWYDGVVRYVLPPEDDEGPNAQLWFRVVYTDNTQDDFTFKQLQKYLVKDGVRASAASVDASRELNEQRELFSEDMESNVHTSDDAHLAPEEVAPALDGYVELLTETSRRVSVAASAKELPFGETYNWNKIFKIRDPEERARHRAAMQKEIDKLLQEGMRWEALPPGEIAIPSVGVFRVKMHDLHEGSSGEPTLKARFCANGQAAAVPSGGWESTATVASYSAILQVVAIAAHYGMEMAQIDVKSAFTQVKLQADQRIWVKPLPGLGDPTGAGRVFRLIHHLYGHPLANAAFQNLWVKLMKEFGFKQVDESGTVFSHEHGKERLLVATVVDDSIVAYLGKALFKKYCDFLESKLPIQVAPLEHVCGMRLQKLEDGSYRVDQTEYIIKKAKLFQCDGAQLKKYSTPMESTFEFDKRLWNISVTLFFDFWECKMIATSFCGIDLDVGT